MAEYLLGIDIGGTGAKAGLFHRDGRPAGSGYVEYQMISPLPGQSEHDAEAWWQATGQAVRQALGDTPATEIAAVGVGCTNGLVAVDARARPLRPAIMLWDQRALPQVDYLRQTFGAESILEITGNPLAPGAYMLPTLLWLKQHEPDVYQAAHKLMVPGGYIVARLTGEFTIDHSRACTTLLFDIRRCEWHQPFLEQLDIAPDKLPWPRASRAVAGYVNQEGAAATGLAAGTPVVAGCMDTLSAALGSGVVEPGEGFLIMGTAARFAAGLAEPRFDPRFMNCTHVEPGQWLTLGAMNGVGSSLRWVRDTFGAAESVVAKGAGLDAYDLLTAQAGLAPPGSKGLLFLPYLSGERTPIWDPYARGVFFGVTLGHTRSDFLRAVLEGPAMAIRQVVQILEAYQGLSVQELKVGGAAAGSQVWMQIMADVLGKPIVTLTSAHTEVLGAALLAGLGVELYPSVPAIVPLASSVGRRFEPDERAHAAYSELFAVYLDLYPDVKPYFERIARLDLPQVWVTRGEKHER